MAKNKTFKIEDLARFASKDVLRMNEETFKSLGGDVPSRGSGRPILHKDDGPFHICTDVNTANVVTDAEIRKYRVDQLNKTERRFYDSFLRTQDGIDFKVIVQPTNFFELEKKGCYTPDFIVVTPDAKPITVIEIKGGYQGPGWEQGYERYFRAAQQYDGKFFEFLMYTWVAKERQWHLNVFRNSSSK